MTRDVVDLVKDRVSMVDLVGHHVQLTERGGVHVGLCPFHAEKTPSFKVWEDHAKCFGCGWRGDVFAWLEQRDGLTFREALQQLARQVGVELREDPEAERRRQERQARTALMRRAAELYHAQLGQEQRAYLHRRGFRDEFIAQYLIGFARPGVLHGLATPEELLAAELWKRSERGVYDGLAGRLVFPIWGRSDEIVGLVGRVLTDEHTPNKFIVVPSGSASLLNERGLRDPAGRHEDGRFVYLCEGDTDTAAAVQAGLPAVGVRGANGLRDDMADLFEGVRRIYVCADGDAAGLHLIEKAGSLFGNRARVVPIPDGEDVCTLLAAGHDLRELANRAVPYVDWVLARLPADVTGDQRQRVVAQLIPVLSRMGRIEAEICAKRLARHLGVTVAAINEELRTARQRAEQNGNGHGHSHGLQGLGVIWQDKVRINPVQFVHDDAMHLCVPLPTWVEDDDGRREQRIEPHVVSSRRDMWRLTPEEMARRGLDYSERKAPRADVVLDRWSRASSPFSIKGYLDGHAQVEPVSLLAEVRDHFRRYIWYPNDHYYDLLALWVVGTYCFLLFRSFPYIHLHSYKEAGKSLTLNVVRGLAWNAVASSSVSPAAMYRTIESCSPTFLIDEAERLGARKRDAEEVDDRLEILKAGYTVGTPVLRCSGDNHDVQSFDVYCPKIFGSIAGIESVLSARMITLRLARVPAGVPLQEFRDDQATRALFQATRDKLHCWALEHGAVIAQRIEDGLDEALRGFGAYAGWADLRNRDRELWSPILTLAVLFDDCGVETGTVVDRDQLLTVRMLRLAREVVEQRRAREAQEQFEVALVEGVLEFLDTYQADRPSGLQDWYPSNALLEYLRSTESLDWLKDTRQIYRELEKCGVIADRSRDWCALKRLGSSKQVRAVRLERRRVLDAAEHLGARMPEL
jgi:DNA primase